MAILDKAYEHLGPGEPTISRWVAFAAKAAGPRKLTTQAGASYPAGSPIIKRS